MLRSWISRLCTVLALLSSAAAAHAEDGYDLWLRYRPLEAQSIQQYRPEARVIVASATPSPTLKAALRELHRGLNGMLSTTIDETDRPRSGAIVLGTPTGSDLIRGMNIVSPALGAEGYVIRHVTLDGKRVIVIAANTDQGVLYGTFHFLRLLQTHQDLRNLDISSAPKLKLRVLDHWDNLDGTVERGYAGSSLWDWWRLPDLIDPRYTDYARADASIGVNGVVINNVNAKPDSLSDAYIAKAAALAEVFRPYGIRVYLSARFSAPIELGGLKTADPLDPAVRAWWTARVEAIYQAIPDFGGFLVKASSEGQPGPADYGRSHADGANMLADALRPHNGAVMWRAFVYSQDKPEDRAKQAFNEFKPLDGKFADNVILQVKNGAIDFQPREPFHPLFGAMPNTAVMMEVQLTKEYLGFATHLVYLGPLYEEALKADTYAAGPGSTVARVIEGTLNHHALTGPPLTGIAGVANIGSDRDWTGSDFNQANWYVFGRLAWDPEASSRSIAEEWVKMTFSNDPAFVKPTVEIMMGSREAVANYMTPLGLHHLMATSHHYGPGPWVDNLSRPEWNPVYYHKADANGIGFDRTSTGSDALGQYSPQAAAGFADPHTMDERYLLWFHHLPWDYQLKSGHTLWDELVMTYTSGVNDVSAMRRQWAILRPYIDAERFETVSANLRVQEREAQWWRDACIAYFQSRSQRPLPAGYAAPEKSLEEYKAITFPYAPK